jgi:hypothetical protein
MVFPFSMDGMLKMIAFGTSSTPSLGQGHGKVHGGHKLIKVCDPLPNLVCEGIRKLLECMITDLLLLATRTPCNLVK